VLVVASLRDAHAHQTSVKYVDLVAGDDEVSITLRFAPGDVTEAMGLAADATPSQGDALAHPAVPRYVQRWIVLAGCEAGAPRVRAADASFVAATWTARCDNPRVLELDLSSFFALDARHEAIVRFAAPHAEAIQTLVRAPQTQLTLRAGHPPSLLAWIRTGMDHIYGGLDHILFVIALLLVVMLCPGVVERSESTGGGDRAGSAGAAGDRALRGLVERSESTVGGDRAGSAGAAGGRALRGLVTWHVRAFLPTLRSTALVITAFTIAHSLTLIAAALGLVTLPSQLVESLIAVSIAYTAAEDVINPAVRWRFWLTFAFGLVHGLGFAGQLAILLPPTDVVAPLLCFNLGVELGQLSIVAVALPVLFVLVRKIGAARYRRIALPILAAPIFLVGVLMVVERVFEVRVLPT
jgi:hypothetical protein